MKKNEQEKLYLGLDLSTQSLTALLIDSDSGAAEKHGINFDQALPHYQTQDGVPSGQDSATALVDPLMWVEALDRLLLKLKNSGLTAKVKGIGVSAQQHGSVYLNHRAANVLASLDHSRPLHQQVQSVLSRPVSPIWMDSSTSRQCAQITEALGGGRAISRLTGSVATERFAGPQIRKFFQESPEAYAETKHIALISSFITSLLGGKLAPLDCGDGLGTNLADVKARQWSSKALEASAPGLASRLPRLLPGDERIGHASPYLCRRYGFDPQCDVIVGTGDNPASLAGLGLVGDSKTRAISLGTSDTYFGYTRQIIDEPRRYGHIFGAADGEYMFLLCFKNGSLARQRIKDEHNISWQDFSRILEVTAPGNKGRAMLPYFQPEITPVVIEAGVQRYGGLAPDDPEGNVRAVAEAQIMSMYLHSGWTGERPLNIRVTAGGSANKGLLKLIAQVFGARVHIHDVSDSAALGAALRAAAVDRPDIGLKDLAANWLGEMHQDVIQATPEETVVFQGPAGLLQVYEACEAFHLSSGPSPNDAIEAFRRDYS